MPPAIRVENLSKRYRIRHGNVGTYRTLRDEIMHTAAAPVRWLRGEPSESVEEFWALKDVSFDVEPGEVVGVIGRNGAGKSTLLKILSRITPPTKGCVEMRGRVGSLLEVGTGFHPELTGRENIFLSGAILGMKRAEIARKFDEIVAFAEIEQFLDTPVKRYSSGMYVRLAFSVAAHLETEILIIDEVLAVGDAQFQKKCLGKMNEVAQGGRTVLFVSHNTSAILALCRSALLLRHGKTVGHGTAGAVVRQYHEDAAADEATTFVRPSAISESSMFLEAELFDQELKPCRVFSSGDVVVLRLRTNPLRYSTTFGVHLRIKSSREELLAYTSSWINNEGEAAIFRGGDTILIKLPSFKGVIDRYTIDVIGNIWGVQHVDNWWDTINFEIADCKPGRSPLVIQSSLQLGGIVLDDVIVTKA